MLRSKWLLNLSRNCVQWCPSQSNKVIISTEAYDKFLNSLSVIVDKGVRQTSALASPELRDRMKRIAEYYMRGRKQIQGKMMILSHETLRKPEEVKGDLENQQYVLGWCVEMLMAYILIVDDIEDGAKTRNGKPCWHLLSDVGSLAMNDASMLRTFIFELLKQHFEGPMYIHTINLFNEAFFHCNVGQYLDAITAKTRDYNNFTMKHYKTIALYKYAYYSVKFPILTALILSNKFNKDSYQNVANIFTDVGIWSQINNDFTDFFDDDSRTGKTGSDIQAGKCTWLAVMALQRCNEAQRKEFEACYGSWEPANVNRIRKLYEELNLIDIYSNEERATYDATVRKIQSLSHNATPSPDFFQIMLDKYYPNVSCSKSYETGATNNK